MRAQWEDLWDTPFTAASAGRLFDHLPCSKCGKKAADITHPDGRVIIKAAAIQRCKGDSCNHAPLSEIYLNAKPTGRLPDDRLDFVIVVKLLTAPLPYSVRHFN